MDPAGIPALVDAIRHLHGVEATHAETTHVHEVAPTGEVVWSGDVETFDVKHPKAERCYAWSEATEAGRRRFFAVLAVAPVYSPSTVSTLARRAAAAVAVAVVVAPFEAVRGRFH